MAETLLSVRTEFAASGFNRLGTTVSNRLINDAYKWLVKQALWPFRETTTSGAAPLTVADIGAIVSVTDTANSNNPLHYKPREELVDCYGDLTTAGVPVWFYIEGGTIVKTYPAGGTLSVRYYKQAVTLSGDSDPLIVPDDWVQLVIDRARYRALLRQGDWGAAQTLKAEVKETLTDMLVDQLGQNVSDPVQVIVYGGE